MIKNISDKKTKEGTNKEQNCYIFLVVMHFIIVIHVFRVLEINDVFGTRHFKGPPGKDCILCALK